MGIKLIGDQEDLVYEHRGAKIHYRRLPAHVRAQIVKRHTKRGMIDWYGSSLAFLEYCITNWSDVESANGSGEPAKFTAELVRYLPDVIQDDILELIGETAEKLEGEAKDLGPTSDSSPKTTD